MFLILNVGRPLANNDTCFGIEEDDEIVNVPLSLDRMSRCKLVLDDDRIIELNVEDYLNHENITTETDMSGYSTITLNNIKNIKIK